MNRFIAGRTFAATSHVMRPRDHYAPVEDVDGGVRFKLVPETVSGVRKNTARCRKPR